MRSVVLIFFLACSQWVLSQHDFMVWTELGVKGKLTKDLTWATELNTRFNNTGVQTFFPQAKLKYKVTKWFKPSVDYRLVVDKNKYTNYKLSHRVNVNAEFGEKFQRLSVELRLRYQYAFNRLNSTSYDADFDQALRFKPEFEYDFKNSIFSPTVGAEIFYNPVYGENGRELNKIRFILGTKLELNGPHGVSIKYLVDKWLQDYSRSLRHVFSVSYSYKF